MLACPRCDGALPEPFFNAPDLQPCPACRTPVQLRLFPAFFQAPAPGSAGETLLVTGESSCFYHVAKRAVVACENCGRFLCALCDVDLNGEHLCPACLESGMRKGRLEQLENRRMLYDSLALTLATAPLLLFYFTILTAPATVYVVLRYWKEPRSRVAPSRWRLVLALIIALLEIAGWAVVVYFIVRYGFPGGRR
jgi:hypothetical protein